MENLWKCVAMFQLKLTELSQKVDILHIKLKDLEDEVSQNGDVFVQLRKAITEVDSSSESSDFYKTE